MPENWFSIRRWFDFSGRASRREYWLFQLLGWIAIIGPAMVMVAFYGDPETTPWPQSSGTDLVYGLLSPLWLAVFVGWVAVKVRRLHDQGKSGWYMFVALIPLIGWIINLVFIFTPGDEGENEYGHDPRHPVPENYAGVF